MKLLNSDQLRAKLATNVRKMNRLTKQNDEIVKILKQRGLQAVDPAGDDISIHPCIMQLDKLQSEPKPLTADELKAGGWWCADASKECANALKSKGLRVFNSSEWKDGSEWCVCSLDSDGDVTRAPFAFSRLKQIHRIGNDFYWGAPSDQAN